MLYFLGLPVIPFIIVDRWANEEPRTAPGNPAFQARGTEADVGTSADHSWLGASYEHFTLARFLPLAGLQPTWLIREGMSWQKYS